MELHNFHALYIFQTQRIYILYTSDQGKKSCLISFGNKRINQNNLKIIASQVQLLALTWCILL